jgi:hypothetical protein
MTLQLFCRKRTTKVGQNPRKYHRHKLDDIRVPLSRRPPQGHPEEDPWLVLLVVLISQRFASLRGGM